jgi:hypothetical protein
MYDREGAEILPPVEELLRILERTVKDELALPPFLDAQIRST